MRKGAIAGNKRFIIIGILIMTGLVITPWSICLGYILPAEQLTGFIVKNFQAFRTVDIHLTTRKVNKQVEGNDLRFKEQLLMESPDRVYSRLLEGDEGERGPFPETTYLQILLSNTKERIELLLTWMGINLQSVAFTRIDGSIAYRIGDREPGAPKILIEKERFIPLLLVYPVPDNPHGDIITIRFDDYRALDQGWYPHEITYSLGDHVREVYSIESVRVNVPIDSSLLRPAGTGLFLDQGHDEIRKEDSDDERLRRIIKVFEEKYQ